mmetsp:Transcript_119535/g.208119  ORF Transcript_119535/g.208119 Transcript_119535/m.208119 type:complete len:268 (+) Transcript_119535:602-1405(+)
MLEQLVGTVNGLCAAGKGCGAIDLIGIRETAGIPHPHVAPPAILVRLWGPAAPEQGTGRRGSVRTDALAAGRTPRAEALSTRVGTAVHPEGQVAVHSAGAHERQLADLSFHLLPDRGWGPQVWVHGLGAETLAPCRDRAVPLHRLVTVCCGRGLQPKGRRGEGRRRAVQLHGRGLGLWEAQALGACRMGLGRGREEGAAGAWCCLPLGLPLDLDLPSGSRGLLLPKGRGAGLLLRGSRREQCTASLVCPPAGRGFRGHFSARAKPLL